MYDNPNQQHEFSTYSLARTKKREAGIKPLRLLSKVGNLSGLRRTFLGSEQNGGVQLTEKTQVNVEGLKEATLAFMTALGQLNEFTIVDNLPKYNEVRKLQSQLEQILLDIIGTLESHLEEEAAVSFSPDDFLKGAIDNIANSGLQGSVVKEIIDVFEEGRNIWIKEKGGVNRVKANFVISTFDSSHSSQREAKDQLKELEKVASNLQEHVEDDIEISVFPHYLTAEVDIRYISSLAVSISVPDLRQESAQNNQLLQRQELDHHEYGSRFLEVAKEIPFSKKSQLQVISIQLSSLEDKMNTLLSVLREDEDLSEEINEDRDQENASFMSDTERRGIRHDVNRLQILLEISPDRDQIENNSYYIFLRNPLDLNRAIPKNDTSLAAVSWLEKTLIEQETLVLRQRIQEFENRVTTQFQVGPNLVPDFYLVLNLESTASIDEIRSAFREMARIYNPDQYRRKISSDSLILLSEEIFKILTQAKVNLLTTDSNKKKYDSLVSRAIRIEFKLQNSMSQSASQEFTGAPRRTENTNLDLIRKLNYALNIGEIKKYLGQLNENGHVFRGYKNDQEVFRYPGQILIEIQLLENRLEDIGLDELNSSIGELSGIYDIRKKVKAELVNKWILFNKDDATLNEILESLKALASTNVVFEGSKAGHSVIRNPLDILNSITEVNQSTSIEELNRMILGVTSMGNLDVKVWRHNKARLTSRWNPFQRVPVPAKIKDRL